MGQSERRISAFHSDEVTNTEWAPEAEFTGGDDTTSTAQTRDSDDVSRTARALGDEFSGGYGRLRAVTGGSGRPFAIYSRSFRGHVVTSSFLVQSEPICQNILF